MIDTQLIISHIDRSISEANMLVLERIEAIEALVNERLPPKKKKPTTSPLKGKSKHGEFGNVRLTDSEYKELHKQWGTVLAHGIKVLDEGIQGHGYKYKDHSFMLKYKWPAERMREHSGDNATLGRGEIG